MTAPTYTLGNQWRSPTKRPPARALRETIAQQVCRETNLTMKELLGADRGRRVSWARHYAMWLMRKEGFSYPEIGRYFGRDHTTVLYACCAHERRMAEEIGEAA